MVDIIEEIKYAFKDCWLPHTFKTTKNDGNYIYQECFRCGQRKVTILHLQSELPNYKWVRHETDQL